MSWNVTFYRLAESNSLVVPGVISDDNVDRNNNGLIKNVLICGVKQTSEKTESSLKEIKFRK